MDQRGGPPRQQGRGGEPRPQGGRYRHRSEQCGVAQQAKPAGQPCHRSAGQVSRPDQQARPARGPGQQRCGSQASSRRTRLPGGQLLRRHRHVLLPPPPRRSPVAVAPQGGQGHPILVIAVEGPGHQGLGAAAAAAAAAAGRACRVGATGLKQGFLELGGQGVAEGLGDGCGGRKEEGRAGGGVGRQKKAAAARWCSCLGTTASWRHCSCLGTTASWRLCASACPPASHLPTITTASIHPSINHRPTPPTHHTSCHGGDRRLTTCLHEGHPHPRGQARDKGTHPTHTHRGHHQLPGP